MIHGFGGTGAIFYRMIGYLRKHFRVVTIDLLGMGGSGRPPFNHTSSRDCIEYFIGSIEAWMRTKKIREENDNQ